MAPVPARAGGVLSLEDCRCPVCLEIFMEPVTLPCTHTFCKGCFLESVDKAALCCPLCRRRVSTWARLNRRSSTLVDQQLWTRIQSAFPLQCRRRLRGQDAGEDGPAGPVCPRVSQPGEVRQEYEDQVTKLTEEKRLFDEEERRASEEYIQRLLAEEEEEVLQEARRRSEEDEELARLLSSQLENPRPPAVTPAKKKKKKEEEEAVAAGHIDRFLTPRLSKGSKENILVPLQAELRPPHLDYYGDVSADPDLRPSSSSVSLEDQLQLSGDPRPSSSKRKSSELDDEEECHALLPPTSPSVEGRGSSLQREVELLSRRQQEDDDRRLALLLQKELDQQEKQRATDRSKGSSDAYLLRQNRRRAGAPSRASSSTPPVGATLSRSKQATLTEMFSSPSS
ncbi:E3 ubiquitin-protein ligase rnf168 [Brachionichthys hirsutus]|uniref:E3 ubiquitin-protein ligase rnf168 n=1 Tax=Brachionichthys hirsutus TaxID=412623 RepID=UPI00360496B5